MLFSFNGKIPELGKDVFIAPSACVIGDVVILDGSSVWFNSVIRADIHYIRIGKKTNVQDGVVIHVTEGKFPCSIGDLVTIGHRAVVHGAEIDSNVLIGMGASILDGAKIGKNTIIAAGTVVPEGIEVPSNILFAGVPGKVKRELSSEEINEIQNSAIKYLKHPKTFEGI